MKSETAYQKPLVFEDLGNGTTHYNYNITEKDHTNEDGEVTPGYECDQVTIHGDVTSSKVISVVIREKYSADKEFALINNYNRYQLATSADKDESYKTEYLAYLSDRTSIKAMVKTDCKTYNIVMDD